MTTLRDHLEAIRDYYAPNLRAHEHAVAALAILDAAEREQVISAETGDSFPTIFRLVSDPEPSA